MLLGAGREKVDDEIDPSVGVRVHCRLGDRIEEGAPIFTLHCRDEARLAAAREALEGSVEMRATPVEPPALVRAVIGGELDA